MIASQHTFPLAVDGHEDRDGDDGDPPDGADLVTPDEHPAEEEEEQSQRDGAEHEAEVADLEEEVGETPLGGYGLTARPPRPVRHLG